MRGRTSRANPRGNGTPSLDSVSKWRLLIILSVLGVGALLYYRWDSRPVAKNQNSHLPPADDLPLRPPLDPRTGLPEEFPPSSKPEDELVPLTNKEPPEEISPDTSVTEEPTKSEPIEDSKPSEIQTEIAQLALEEDNFPDLPEPTKYKKGDTVFFIHIPKTAGFTFRRILQQFIARSEAEGGKKPFNQDPGVALTQQQPPTDTKSEKNSTDLPDAGNNAARQRGPVRRARKTCVVYCSCKEGLGESPGSHTSPPKFFFFKGIILITVFYQE